MDNPMSVLKLVYVQGEIQIALFKDASFYLDRHVDTESKWKIPKSHIMWAL